MTDDLFADLRAAFEKVDKAPYRYEPVMGTREYIEANRHLLDGSNKPPPLPNVKVVDGLPDDMILFAAPRVDDACRLRQCDHTHVVAIRVEDE